MLVALLFCVLCLLLFLPCGAVCCLFEGGLGSLAFLILVVRGNQDSALPGVFCGLGGVVGSLAFWILFWRVIQDSAWPGKFHEMPSSIFSSLNGCPLICRLAMGLGVVAIYVPLGSSGRRRTCALCRGINIMFIIIIIIIIIIVVVVVVVVTSVIAASVLD